MASLTDEDRKLLESEIRAFLKATRELEAYEGPFDLQLRGIARRKKIERLRKEVRDRTSALKSLLGDDHAD